MAYTLRDLFGKPIQGRRPKYEWSLEQVEKRTLPIRAARVRWLERVIPRRTGFVMPVQTFYVYEEAKSAFVYGCFSATIVLAAAFVEHWLGARLASRGFSTAAEQGLAAMTDCCRSNNLLLPGMAERIDHLRRIRNPFVHLKSFDHPHGLSQRAFRGKTHIEEVLESDARESLVTMYTVARYAFADT